MNWFDIKIYNLLDNLAYRIYTVEYNQGIKEFPKIGKQFFVGHKNYPPYETYYKKAIVELRCGKISKIINKIQKLDG